MAEAVICGPTPPPPRGDREGGAGRLHARLRAPDRPGAGGFLDFYGREVIPAFAERTATRRKRRRGWRAPAAVRGPLAHGEVSRDDVPRDTRGMGTSASRRPPDSTPRDVPSTPVRAAPASPGMRRDGRRPRRGRNRRTDARDGGRDPSCGSALTSIVGSRTSDSDGAICGARVRR